MKTSIITIANQKGGVGKTTTVINLASSYAAMGKKILVIDTDSQANATYGLGLGQKTGSNEYNLARAITENLTLDDVATPTDFENIDLVPASHDLVSIEPVLYGKPSQNVIIDKLLRTDKKNDYDVIIIDTHPSLNTYFQASLKSSHYYLIPLFAEEYSASGLRRQINAVEDIRQNLNPMLTFLGAVITNFKKSSASHQQFEEVIRDIGDKAGFKILKTKIPHSDAVSSAMSMRKPLNLYHNARSLPVTQAYAALAGEILPELKGKRIGRKYSPIDPKAFEDYGLQKSLEL